MSQDTQKDEWWLEDPFCDLDYDDDGRKHRTYDIPAIINEAQLQERNRLIEQFKECPRCHLEYRRGKEVERERILGIVVRELKIEHDRYYDKECKVMPLEVRQELRQERDTVMGVYEHILSALDEGKV